MEEDARNLLEELYLSTFVFKGDVQQEKEELLCHYLLVLKLFNERFKENRNLEAAIDYFSKIMQEFFNETDFETMVCEKIINYFKSFEYLSDCNDILKLKTIEEILLEFDGKIEDRYLEEMNMLEYYTDIIESGILTNKNFYYRGLTQKTSEEKKVIILAKIPEVKRDV